MAILSAYVITGDREAVQVITGRIIKTRTASGTGILSQSYERTDRGKFEIALAFFPRGDRLPASFESIEELVASKVGDAILDNGAAREIIDSQLSSGPRGLLFARLLMAYLPRQHTSGIRPPARAAASPV